MKTNYLKYHCVIISYNLSKQVFYYPLAFSSRDFLMIQSNLNQLNLKFRGTLIDITCFQKFAKSAKTVLAKQSIAIKTRVL